MGIYVDVRLYRDGLTFALSGIDGIEVAASVADASPAGVALLRAAQPDIVLAEAGGPDGADVLRRFAESIPGATIVALAIDDVGDVVVACAEAGVAAYTTRNSSLDELVDTLRRAARGEVVLAPHVGRALMQRVHALAGERADGQARARLTRREREIMELVDAGLSNKQIAQRLSIQLATVKNHVHNILGKLGVDRRAEAAATIRPSSFDQSQT